MTAPLASPDFRSLVVPHARKDFPLLDAQASLAGALERVRREGVGERVIYFFAVDPKIAAGPVALAVTDFFALTFYFSLAWLVL